MCLQLILWVDNVLFAPGKDLRGVLTEQVVTVPRTIKYRRCFPPLEETPVAKCVSSSTVLNAANEREYDGGICKASCLANA